MSMKGKLGVYLSKIANDTGKFEILQLFETSIDTSHPEQGEVPIKLLGYGEISIVFEILTEELQGLAFKRLPLFETEQQVSRHVQAYADYHQILTDLVHLTVPLQESKWVYMDEDHSRIALYCIQDKVPADTVISRRLPDISKAELKPLFLAVLGELKKIWDFNLTNNAGLEIGIDGQISNWALVSGQSQGEVNPKVLYLDTSTPLFRRNGEEAMEAALFMKSAPSFLRWTLKSLVQEVVDRYYDAQSVLTDLIANFYKEQRADLIPHLIDWVNAFFAEDMERFGISPLNEQEIKSYYKHDKFIWVLYLNLRKFDRFLKTKIMRKKYDFYLPAKIKR